MTFEAAALHYGSVANSAIADEYFASARALENANTDEEHRRAKARLWMAGKRLFGCPHACCRARS